MGYSPWSCTESGTAEVTEQQQHTVSIKDIYNRYAVYFMLCIIHLNSKYSTVYMYHIN